MWFHITVNCRAERSWNLLVCKAALWLWAHLEPPHLSRTGVMTHIWMNEALNWTRNSYTEPGKCVFDRRGLFWGHFPWQQHWIMSLLGEGLPVPVAEPPDICVTPVAQSLSSPACSWIHTPVQVNLCQCLQSTRAMRNDKQQCFQPRISDSLEQAPFQRAGFCYYFSQACLPISTCRVKHGRRGILLRKSSSYKTKGIPFNYSQQAD